jgi:undecaprenyl diphosphate synthase
LQVAFNYGGRADIVDAARQFAVAVAEGRASPQDLDETAFEGGLSTGGAPAPDLIVRTSGERRLSNFLLWECAYAELVFQDVYWPDYGPEHLRAAIAEFRSRERRFGGVAVDDVVAAS